MTSVSPNHPTLSLTSDDPIPVSPSVIHVPVSFDLLSALSQMEAMVPTQFGDWNSGWIEDPPGNRYKYIFEATRDAFQFTMDGASLYIACTIYYRARGAYDPPVLPMVTASCGDGEERRRLKAVFRTTVSIGPDWRIQSNTTVHFVGRYSNDDRDQCRMTILNFDVTGKIEDAARAILAGKGALVDQRIAGLDLRSRAESLWKRIDEPVQVTPNLRFRVNPQSISLHSISGSGTSLRATLTLTCTPTIDSDTRTPLVHPLPPLSDDASGEGFHVLLEATLTHDVASEMARQQLIGKRFYRGALYVQIESVDIYGVGSNTAILQMAFKGSVAGVIYCVGEPVYNVLTGVLYIANMRFDVDTESELRNGAAWLNSQDFLSFVAAHMKWPIGDKFESAKQDLTRAVNRDLGPGVSLSGRVETLEGVGVRVDTRQFWIRVRADGHVDVTGNV